MQINGKKYKTIWHDNNIVKIIDQTKLPHKFVIKDLVTAEDAIEDAIPDFKLYKKKILIGQMSFIF